MTKGICNSFRGFDVAAASLQNNRKPIPAWALLNTVFDCSSYQFVYRLLNWAAPRKNVRVHLVF